MVLITNQLENSISMTHGCTTTTQVAIAEKAAK